MPTHSFSSFEAYFAAVQNLAGVRAMVLGPVRSKWVLTRLNLNKVEIQWGEAGSKMSADGSPRPGGLSLLFTTRKSASFWGNGNLFTQQSLMVTAPGDVFSICADLSRRWCSLYIPYELLASGNSDLAQLPMRGFFQLPNQQFERFRWAIAQIDNINQLDPNAFDSAASKTATEQKLLPEIRQILSIPPVVEQPFGRRTVPREQIIRLSMAFVDQHDGEYLSVAQLASAACVSERTLRDAFQQYFGEGPVRYLKARTLHQVRSALKNSDPSLHSVTEVAAQFGVWQLGRFARDYHTLFGELPSATLQH
jgi:AraC-like DNA-binding protein